MSRTSILNPLVWLMSAALALLAGGAEVAQATNEVQKLTASDAGSGDAFGRSVSVSGDTAIVGAAGDDCAAGWLCGSAYVFRFDGVNWVEEQKLTASDAAQGLYFGWKVSVSGDTAVVGAWGHHCAPEYYCGSAYFFRVDGATWVEEQKVIGGRSYGYFGSGVSVSGDTAVVGKVPYGSPESAYVFRFDGTTWVQEQELYVGGASVSISGDTVVAGAFSADCERGYPVNCGAAYVFRFDGNTWVVEQELTASDAAHWDHFGGSVSVSGDTIMVGAAGNECSYGPSCGSAYVFRYDGATWMQELRALGHFDFESFGSSVAVSGDTAVVGAPGGESDAGVAHVYRYDGETWVHREWLTASDESVWDEFGTVSVNGDTVLVGARGDNCAAGNGCGSVYVFSLARPTRSSPANDSIDARQPSDLACTELFGWDSIDIKYTGNITDVQASDFTVTVDPADVTQPSIVNVASNGHTATLTFDRRIPLGHWTIITHDASGFVTRIAALPADVNGDGTSSPLDVLSLIDFLNGVGEALEFWQTDLDRSGEANSADILRVIDLLNGADCFDPWNWETLPE